MGRKTNEVKAKERFFRILLSAGFTDITKNFYKEKGYSEEVLANYSKLIKRAFQKGKYIINYKCYNYSSIQAFNKVITLKKSLSLNFSTNLTFLLS